MTRLLSIDRCLPGRPGESAARRYQRRSIVPQVIDGSFVSFPPMPPSVAPVRSARAVRCTRSLSLVPTLELLSADALRSTVVTFRDAMRAHAAGDQPAERLPGARRRHRHQHGPHARRRRGRARRRAAPTSTPTCDAISHGSLMGARGNSGVILSQILRGLAVDAEAASPDGAAATARVAEALTGGVRRRRTRRC